MKKLGSLILLLFLCLGITPLGAADAATQTLLRQANSLEARGRLDLAAQNWRRVLLADPDQADALAGLARYAKQKGQLDESKRYTDRLREVAPNHPALAQIDSLKAIVGREGRLEEARRLAANQDYDQALAIYREVFGPAPPPGPWVSAYYETEAAVSGGWERAVSGLRTFLTQFPDVPEYRLSLGRVLTYRAETRAEGVRLLESVQGDPSAEQQARQAWRQALVWEGPKPSSLESLRSYLSRYQDAELQGVLQKAEQVRTSQAKTSGVPEQEAYTALQAGRLEEAERLFQAAVRENPKSAGAQAGLGFVRMKQDNFDSALEYFKAAEEITPGDPVVVEALQTAVFWQGLSRAGIAFELGKLDEASAQYEGALKARPDNAEALRGMAGVLMKQKRYAEAVPYYRQIVELNSADAPAWAELLRAVYQSEGTSEAFALLKSIPSDASAKLSKNVGHLITVASIYGDIQQHAEFDRVFQEVLRLTPNDASELGPVRLLFAGLLLKMDRPVEAAAEYERSVESDPDNIDAWEGMIAALMKHQNARAMAVLRRMPEGVYEKALERPAFLVNAGLIHREAGRLKEAEEFFNRALQIEAEKGNAPDVNAQLLLAQVWVEQGKAEEAERLLRELAARQPGNAEVWKTLIGTLHKRGRQDEAIAESLHVPATLITRMFNDPDYVALMASVYNARGEYHEGLRLLREAVTNMRVDNQHVPVEMEIQMAWLLLNSNADRRELFEVLQRNMKRNDLDDKQKKELADLWSIWSQREAESALNSGDTERAISILTAAMRLFPDDTRIYSALAGALLKAGDAPRALFVYKSWGLREAVATDYAGAIGAAMGAQDHGLAERWINDALRLWPSDPELLTLAGRQAAARGDYQRAEAFWRAALRTMPGGRGVSAQTAQASSAAHPDDMTQDLGQLLLRDILPQPAPGGSYVTPPPPPVSPAGSGVYQPLSNDSSGQNQEPLAASLLAALAAERQGNAGVTGLPPASSIPAASWNANSAVPSQTYPARVSRVSESRAAAASGSNPTVAAVPFDRPASPIRLFTEDTAPSRTRREEVEDQIAALQARNSPYARSHAKLRSRSGREGFESLNVQQMDLEAATTVADKFRVSFTARPTFLDAGTPERTSPLRLGLSPAGAALGAMTSSGIGAELALSSDTFGLSVGSTPRGFLVENVTFGMRFRPAGSPISILFDRDSVRDTMLSYAGVQDPLSQRVFGGVMANSVALQGDWGKGDSGVYIRAGYQSLTGRDVLRNQRVDGGGGAWWRVMEREDGSLTIGINLFAMKYAKNLRFFTLGHGGYFSPQRYLLFSVPVRWEGTYNGRFDYMISGSIGSQHIQEDAAPFFPTDAVLQGRSGPFYPELTRTGGNYSLDFQGGYRVTPNWVLGGFLAVNNSRNYTDQAAGFYVNYSFRPEPVFQQVHVPSFPDWRGNRLVGLP